MNAIAALDDPVLTAAVDEFLAAHAASKAASETVRLTQAGGWSLDDEAERLFHLAEDALDRLDLAWSFEEDEAPEELLDAVREYGYRPRVVNKVTPAPDWETAVGDWGRSGSAA